MNHLKQQKINVYEEFLAHFNKQSKTLVLEWIKKVMELYYDAGYSDYNNQVIMLIDAHIKGNHNVVEARNLALKIHKLAKIRQNDQQFYLRALAHMVSTIHVKTHALKCCDYIIKMVQFKTKDNDLVIGERLRQIVLLTNN
ncbi:MAG: putative immunity protein [Acholeplasma sp.]